MPDERPNLVLRGHFPPGESVPFDLELTARGKSLRWFDEKNDKAAVVYAPKHDVLTLAVLPDVGPGLLLYAMPGTTNSRPAGPSEGRGTVWSFRAMLLEAPHPWHEGTHYFKNMFHDVQLQCDAKFYI